MQKPLVSNLKIWNQKLQLSKNVESLGNEWGYYNKYFRRSKIVFTCCFGAEIISKTIVSKTEKQKKKKNGKSLPVA